MTESEDEAEESPGRGLAGFHKTRLEALSDGIFAVAMTLLVLDLKLGSDSAVDSEAGLIGRVLSLEHTFVIYIVSFGVLAMLWISHIAQFHYIRFVNGTLIWINLFYLASVCLIPFSTSLIGDFDYLRTPYIVYGVNIMMASALMFANLRYMQKTPSLTGPAFTPWIQRRIGRRILLFTAVPVLCTVVAFYETRAALYLYFLLVVVHFMPGGRLAPRDEKADNEIEPPDR